MKTKFSTTAGLARKHCSLACCLALGLAFAGIGNLARAQYQRTDPSSPRNDEPGMTTHRDIDQSSLSHADKKFIENAAEANAHELALSQLAADKATNPDVRAFAQKMVTDHQQLASDLADLAVRKGVKIDEEVRDGQEKDVKSFTNKSGNEFDREYAKKMVKGHKDALELFQKAATDCKDPEVVALASKYLPIITEHNEHARMLGDQFK